MGGFEALFVKPTGWWFVYAVQRSIEDILDSAITNDLTGSPHIENFACTYYTITKCVYKVYKVTF